MPVHRLPHEKALHYCLYRGISLIQAKAAVILRAKTEPVHFGHVVMKYELQLGHYSIREDMHLQ